MLPNNLEPGEPIDEIGVDLQTEAELAYDEWCAETSEYETGERKFSHEEVLFQRLHKWLHISDEDRAVVEFALAVYKSHDLTGADPLWGIIVGASGGGKSETLRALLSLPNAFHLSKPTPNSLASGFKGKGGKENDPSLLPMMDGKVVIMPDFAPILDMNPQMRSETLGMLREAFDGTIAVGKGNIGRVVYKSRFSLLTASTGAIDDLGTAMSSLGERFVRIRYRSDDGDDKAERATVNFGSATEMRSEIAAAIAGFLKTLGDINAVKYSTDIRKQIARLASFTARARSPISRDRFSHDIVSHPVPEEGGRLGVQLMKLLTAITVIRGRMESNQDDVAFVRRIAEDSIPPLRLSILELLKVTPEGLNISQIAALIDYPHSTTTRALEDLVLLRLISRENNPSDKRVSVFKRL